MLELILLMELELVLVPELMLAKTWLDRLLLDSMELVQLDKLPL